MERAIEQKEGYLREVVKVVNFERCLKKIKISVLKHLDKPDKCLKISTFKVPGIDLKFL